MQNLVLVSLIQNVFRHWKVDIRFGALLAALEIVIICIWSVESGHEDWNIYFVNKIQRCEQFLVLSSLVYNESGIGRLDIIVWSVVSGFGNWFETSFICVWSVESGHEDWNMYFVNKIQRCEQFLVLVSLVHNESGIGRLDIIVWSVVSGLVNLFETSFICIRSVESGHEALEHII